MHQVSKRIVTMPIQSQGIITRDNVSVDVSAVAYFRVTDTVKSVVAIENVYAAIDQIAQTTLRKVVGQHTLDETLSETDRINLDIREILDVTTVEWGVEVTLVELKDIQLPDSMKRAMARQAVQPHPVRGRGTRRRVTIIRGGQTIETGSLDELRTLGRTSIVADLAVAGRPESSAWHLQSSGRWDTGSLPGEHQRA